MLGSYSLNVLLTWRLVANSIEKKYPKEEDDAKSSLLCVRNESNMLDCVKIYNNPAERNPLAVE